MRQIIELIDVLDNTPGISDYVPRETRYYAFYELIKKGAVQNDSDAASLLYKCKPGDKRYSVLKTRFKAKLLNVVLQGKRYYAHPKDYDSAQYICNRNIENIRILRSRSAYHCAHELVEKTLRIARKFHLYDIALAIMEIRLETACFSDTHNTFNKYADELAHIRSIYYAESKNRENYLRIYSLYIKASSITPAILEEAREYLHGIAGDSHRFQTLSLVTTHFKLGSLVSQMQADYDSVLQHCRLLKDFLIGKPHLSMPAIQCDIVIKILASHFHQKRYQEGLEIAVRDELYFKEADYLKLLYTEFCFLLALRAQNIKLAIEYYKIAHSCIHTTDFTTTHRDKWRVFEIYLRLTMASLSPSDTLPTNLTFGESPFNAEHFLNDIPIFSQYKRGYNINLLIAHILYLLVLQRTIGVRSRSDALRKYLGRYLQGPEFIRTRYFIKLLRILPTNAFHPQKVARHGMKLLSELGECTANYQGTLESLELYPYEQLWDWILTLLQAIHSQSTHKIIKQH